jgi:hypothetical protein
VKKKIIFARDFLPVFPVNPVEIFF